MQRVLKTAQLRLLTTTLVCGLAALMVGCDPTMEGIASAFALDAPTCQTPLDSDQLVSDVLDRVNQERLIRGMNPLELSEELSAFGGAYACTMIEDRFFGHDHPLTGENFEDRIVSSKYNCFQTVGENLARGQSSADSVFEDWAGSPNHFENILTDEYRQMGLAVRSGSGGQLYWVQLFLGDPFPFTECDQPETLLTDPDDLTGGLDASPTLPVTTVPLSGDSNDTATPQSDDLLAAEPE